MKFGNRLDRYPCDSDQVCLYHISGKEIVGFFPIRNYISALNVHIKDLELTPIYYTRHRIKKIKGDEVK